MSGVPEYFCVERARLAQRKISSLVIKRDILPNEILTVGGVDVTYIDELAIGAAVCLNYRTLNLLDRAFSVTKVKFPYIPTLLAFREVAPAIVAYNLLKIKPDVLLVDGQGLLHPYRAGFACHLGVALRKPVIGVAKKLLCGSIKNWIGNIAYIEDKGEVIGVAFKSNPKWNPIYLSIGNMVSLDTAIKIVRHTLKRGKLPEPIRRAHGLAKQVKSGLSKKFKNFFDDFRRAGEFSAHEFFV